MIPYRLYHKVAAGKRRDGQVVRKRPNHNRDGRLETCASCRQAGLAYLRGLNSWRSLEDACDLISSAFANAQLQIDHWNVACTIRMVKMVKIHKLHDLFSHQTNEITQETSRRRKSLYPRRLGSRIRKCGRLTVVRVKVHRFAFRLCCREGEQEESERSTQ